MSAAAIAQSLGNVRRAGDEYVCTCPLADEHAHGDADPSLYLKDASTGAILVRCRSRHSSEQDRVIAALKARHLWPSDNGARPSSEQKAEDYVIVSHVPSDAPDPNLLAAFLKTKKIEEAGKSVRECSRFDYCDGQGRWSFSTFRFDTIATSAKGNHKSGKDVLPASLWFKRSAGKLVWRSKWPPPPRPLYALDVLARRPNDPVLVLEGEGKCEAANGLKDFEYVAAAFSGGSKRVRESDFSTLATRHVVVWPDNDKTGFGAAIEAAHATEGAQLQVRGAITQGVQIVKPDPTWPVGHDIGDLIEVGWTAQQLLDYIASHSVIVDVFEDYARERFKPETAEPRAIAVDPDIARLAALAPLEYDKCRKDEAKSLGVRVNVLDAEVEKARPKAETNESRESLAPAPPDPWPDPVDAAALLDELHAFIKRLAVVSEHALTAIVLWVAFTYFFEVAETSPRLAILSPTKRCGKTRVLEMLLMLCLRPVSASNLSPSAIFRTVDQEHPTLIIDEADTLNANKNDELRGILNSGHTPANAYVIRNIPVGEKEWMPHKFSTWCPVSIAAIGKLPETWLDRSIVIWMQRKPRTVKVERLTRRNAAVREQGAALQRKLARLAADNLESVRAANPAIPDLASDRAIDNWEHLLGIAALGGTEWAKKAEVAALALSGDAADENNSLGEILLSDLHQLFGNHEFLTSASICEKLAEREDRPWPEYRRGKPLTPKQLASLLRPFGVVPSTVGGTAKGYRREWFETIFARYLPDSKRPNVQPTGVVGESTDFASVQHDGLDGLKNGTNPNADMGLDGWTGEKEEMGARNAFLADPVMERLDASDDEDPDRERFD